MTTAAKPASMGRSRNPRVRLVDRAAWKHHRNLFFRHNVNLAARAKATRTAVGVTQAEMAKHLDLSVTSICNRESGFYTWPGGEREVEQYQRACMRLAGIRS